MPEKKRKSISVSSSEEEHSSSSGENSYSIDDSHGGYTTHTRVKRLRANDRERRRVHLINCAMESLRDVIPGLKEKRKLTKLELLRAANQYIWILDEALRTGHTIDEILNGPKELPRIYYVGSFGYAMPTLKRETNG
ncbi:neurogenin-2-like isoform X2 [Hydractinia symbiolongicarpus]|nr:neurogenin-2-like isoform X2 [Hydractinia symbiolongicarpus]